MSGYCALTAALLVLVVAAGFASVGLVGYGVAIHLGKEATETLVKSAQLSDYRVIYFATHGLVAGEIKDLAEPSLVLSLPKQSTTLDDGLLTASEVAQLWQSHSCVSRIRSCVA
jgi:hypothetical protein